MSTDRAIRIEGLGEDFDRLIRNLPDAIFKSPDEPWCTAALSADPFSVLAELREREGPIVRRGADGRFGGVELPEPFGHDPAKPLFAALTYDAVHEIAADASRFASEGAYRASEEIQGRTINTRDGDDHLRIRRLFDKSMFGRRQTEDYLHSVTEPVVGYLVDRIARRLRDGEDVEICRDLALPMVYKSISTIIGVPERLFAAFVELGEAAFGYARNPQRAREAVAALNDHFAAELAARRSDPAAPRDMMTIMSESSLKDYRLTDEEIVMHCRFLLPGGIETTWRQTANMFMALMLHPDQWRAITEDPALVDQTVEEVLRWVPTGSLVPRRVLVDTEVAGVALPAGAAINNIQIIANRDPQHWEHPDRFDIFRPVKPHLTFHAGAHFCMGQNLARNSLRTALREMAARLPDLRLACSPGDVEMSGFALHVVRRLPVRLEGSSSWKP